VRALAAAGSLGVSIAMQTNLGKTPTQNDVTDQLASLSGLQPSSPLFVSIISSISLSSGLPPTAFSASVNAGSVGFSNLPFIVAPTPVAAAAAASGSANSGVVIGVIVLCVVVVLFIAIWMWRSWAKHGKLPCFRDRGAEKRAALAALAARNTGAEESELTVRTLASTVATLKAELAAKKAMEIAERNAAAGGGGAGAGSMTLSPLAKARAEAVADGAVAAALEKRGAFAPVGAR
jgi:hypothetical protein